jgi:Kef-type K+ transport system membrane component KefB
MLVMVLGLVGPLLAAPRRFAIPVAVGEILAGVIFGRSGFHIIDTSAPNLSLLGQLGFALVMMVTASHIDVRRIFGAKAAGRAGINFGLVLVGAIAAAVGIGYLTGQSSNIPLFAVVLASSSAAVVLPSFTTDAAGKAGSFATFLVQVTIADLIAIVALPIVSKSSNTGGVALGALVVTGASVAIYGLLRWAQGNGDWKHMRQFSAQHGFGLELRLSFILLLGLICVAQSFAVTIMIAGFGLGLAIAANGIPHRLAKQLFAVSEGFFSPVFFVLLGAGINITAVFAQPELLLLAVLLGLGAIAVHLLPVMRGLPVRFAVASSAQLGVPAAAVSIGISTNAITDAQAGAIMLGALITLAATAIAAAAKGKAN